MISKKLEADFVKGQQIFDRAHIVENKHAKNNLDTLKQVVESQNYILLNPTTHRA